MQWLSKIIKGQRCHVVSIVTAEAKPCYAALCATVIYTKITEPSISFRKRKSVRTQAGNCGIFTQLIPNFFIAKRKQNKTLFWNRIKDVSSVQWKLHQFKSRQGNHLACKQSGLFREGAHYGMLCSTSSLVFPMWVEVNLKGRSIWRISVNL